MADRSRKNTFQVYLSDDEKYILDKKWELSNMSSRSAFIRHLIIHGFVYDIDYSELTEYSKQLNKIGVNINQLTKRIMKTLQLNRIGLSCNYSRMRFSLMNMQS